MSYISDTFAYLADPASWTGSMGIWPLLAQHLVYSAIAVLIACLIGLPIGWWTGRTGRGAGLTSAGTGAARALPTLGLVTLLALAFGIGAVAPVLALVVLALPSVVTGAASGVAAADPGAVDGARASGMTEWQVLRSVEIPLGAPVLVGGIRSASLQVIATATLAAYTGGGGLGRLMFLGLKTQDYAMMLASAVLVIALAIVSEALFATIQRAVRPAGSRRRSTRKATA